MPRQINPMVVKTFRLEPYVIRAIEMIKRTTGKRTNSEVVREAIDKYIKDNNLPFAGGEEEGEPLSVSLLGVINAKEEMEDDD